MWPQIMLQEHYVNPSLNTELLPTFLIAFYAPFIIIPELFLQINECIFTKPCENVRNLIHIS